MWFVVWKLITNHHRFEAMHHPEYGKQQFGISARRVGTANIGRLVRSATASSVINPGMGWICPETSLQKASSLVSMTAA